MSYISAVKVGEKVFVWERDAKNNRRKVSYDAPYYFYIEDEEDGDYTSIDGKKLSRVDASSEYLFREYRNKCKDRGVEMYESDISPDLKILSEHYYGKKSPKLNVTFYDIEVDYSTEKGFSSPSNPYALVNAVALFHEHENKMVVIAIPPDDATCDVPELGLSLIHI